MTMTPDKAKKFVGSHVPVTWLQSKLRHDWPPYCVAPLGHVV
jgi:hypothetical protein